MAEIAPLGFTHSNQVTSYIRKNKLGQKYEHISGVVKMEENGYTWDYHDGFSKEIYANLCLALGLDNQRSPAHVVGFTPNKELRHNKGL